MELAEKISFIHSRITSLIEQKELLTSQASNWKELYAEATEVQKKLIGQSTENARQADHFRVEVSELKTSLYEARQSADASQARNAELERKILRLQRIEEEFKIADSQAAELRTMISDLEQQLGASQDLNKELQEEVQEARMQLTELQGVSIQAEELRAQLAKAVEEHTVEASALHSRISELESSRMTESSDRSETDSLIASLQEDIRQKQSALSVLNNQLEDMQHHLANNPLKEANDFLNTRVAQLEAEIVNLKYERQVMEESIHIMEEKEKSAGIAEAMQPEQGMGDERYDLLYHELQSSLAANAALEKQLGAYMQIIAGNGLGEGQFPEGIKNPVEQKNFIKLAEAIDENSVESNIELKGRLNEMIKEIDRCIAKLSS
jgi:chromosome segregation ATPase